MGPRPGTFAREKTSYQPGTTNFKSAQPSGRCLAQAGLGRRGEERCRASGTGDDQDSYRQVPGVMEGAKEDAESWRQFPRHLKQRGLRGVRLVTSGKCRGLMEALDEFYL